jgi:hypothetical protein
MKKVLEEAPMGNHRDLADSPAERLSVCPARLDSLKFLVKLREK